MSNANEINLEESDGWVDLYDTEDAVFIDLVRSELKRRFKDNGHHAKQLAEEIAGAQYRVESFMEELARAATRLNDE
jgi:hypothetical protein